MFSLSLRRTLCRSAAAALLCFAGIASAQTAAFSPSSIGKPLVLEGRVTVRVEDFADGKSRTRHFLTTTQGRVELKFAGDAPHLVGGSRVRVRGVAQGVDTLQLDGGAGSIETLLSGAPYTMGEQPIAIVLVNFQDDTSQPTTIADAQNLVFRDVNNHYLESSFGQTWFKGQVFGWFTIAMSKNQCHPDLLASLADQKAAQAGVNLGQFRRRVYMFPKNACMNLGEAEVGGADSRAWINGAMTLQVVGHELGHNYGLMHAHSMNCDTGVFNNVCDYYDYGDVADLMGNGRPGQFNAWEKEQLGWLNDGVSPPIKSVTAPGRYSIEPYSANTAGIKALKIPAAHASYYVEYRQPIGADAVLADVGNITKGVVVHLIGDGENASTLLDMSPGSATNNFDEMADGALAVGQTHVDPYTGVAIKLVSISSAGADIDVSFGTPTCVRNAPAITLTSDGAAVQAGAAVAYTLSITNRDTADCSPVDFAVSLNVPDGWSGGFNSWASLKSGSTARGTFNVASPESAKPGTYGVAVATSSSLNAKHTTSGSATYTVAPPPCTRNAPLVSLTGGTVPAAPGATVGYTMKVTNRDSSGCPATTFALARSVPTGWAGTLGKSSMSLSPGASDSASLGVTSPSTAAGGTYAIGVAASSTVGATHTANAATTYLVAPKLSISDATVIEGNTGARTASFTVSLAQPAVAPVTFSIATKNGTALAGSDYAATSRTGVTIPKGASSAVVTVSVIGETAVEGNETFQVVVSNVVGAVVADGTAVGTIRNDDTRLSIGDVSISEGNSGTRVATFTVSLSNASASAVTFSIATGNGTAVAGSDYISFALSGQTIPAGATSKTFSATIKGDTVREANETFLVKIAGVGGATVADAQALGTIVNDD